MTPGFKPFTLEKVSNLVKLSLVLFYRAYKYKLIILNKQIHISTFHSIYSSIPESVVP